MDSSTSIETVADEAQPVTDGQPRDASELGPPVVTASHLTKTFKLPRHTPHTLKERVLHPFRRGEVQEFNAVQDVSFEVRKGEFFGIVGRNGSGKSTMLKLLAGIYRPTSGTVSVDGRISPFIELGVGFNFELDARDNVIINGTLLGLSRAEALRRFDSIIEFAELEDFVDLKVKNYSSGMQVRLAFSTAIQVDADILLLDEVLAVGDAGFQDKCYEVFRQMKAAGKTIILVTHDLNAVERFCDRAMLLDRGKVLGIDTPSEVIHLYQDSLGEVGTGGAWRETDRFGDGAAEIVDAWFENAAGERMTALEQGERISFRSEIVFHRKMVNPIFGITLVDETERNVFVSNTLWRKIDTGAFEPGDRATFTIAVDNHFGVGQYHAWPAIAHQETVQEADSRRNMLAMTVRGRRWTGSVVEPPHEYSVDRE